MPDNTALLSFLIPFALCWGSFLNVLAYRLVYGRPLFRGRSACPECDHAIAWYDLIPVVSWFVLGGICRHCQQPISPLYPAIELLTVVACVALVLLLPAHTWLAYWLFFSALLITIHTDMRTMLIARHVTLFALPLGVISAWLGLIPITASQSILGAGFGYYLLYSIAYVYYRLTGRAGIGEGDFELLAFIGSFTGIVGCWVTLLLGSLLGTLAGLPLLIMQPEDARTRAIPFGPFLALGAMLYVLYQKELVSLLLGL